MFKFCCRFAKDFMSVPGTLRYGNLLVKGSHQLLNISIIIIAL